MAGDRIEGAQPPAAAPESSDLFGHVMGGLRSIRDTTGSVVKQGLAKSEEAIHSPTAQKIAGTVSDTAKQALHKGQEIAQSPTARKITGQVVVAGEQVAQEHMNKVHGVINAGKRGDVNGVIHNGLPLAGEVLLGPAATAAMIAKDKGGKILIDNVPAEHRQTAQRLKSATDLATMKPNLPDLIIQGTHSGKY